MSTIKTWAERAESLSDDTVVTSLHLAQFRQAEIDELRSENARLQDALLTNDTTIESANNAAGMLEAGKRTAASCFGLVFVIASIRLGLHRKLNRARGRQD